MPSPTRRTSESDLARWNMAMRASPAYQNFMRAQGLSTDGRVKLSRSQQEGLERALKTSGVEIPSGMHIDQGGNLNQKNRLGKVAAIGAAGTLAAFGIPGVFPGLAFGGGGGAAGTSFGMGAAGSAGPAGLGWTTGLGAGAFPPAGGLLGGAAAAGAGAGASAGATAGAASRSLLERIAGVAVPAAGAIGAATSAAQRPPGSSPEAQGLIDQQRRRLEQSNDLYETVLGLAYGRLPVSAQAGGAIPSYATANATVPSVGADGEYTEDRATRELLRSQMVRGRMSDPLYDAILRLAKGRMPGGVT